jgi:ribosomal protein S18 acetylase RimI-like enzyme
MGKSELNAGFLHKSMLDAFLEMCKRTGVSEYFKKTFYKDIFKDQDYEHTIVVAEKGGKLVGALFWIRPEGRDSVALVLCRGYSSVVVPEFRELGVEKALASYIAEEASRCKYKGVYIMGTVLERRDADEYERIVSSFLERSFTQGWRRQSMWREVGEDDKCFKSDLVFRDLNEVRLELVVNVSVEACSDTLDRIFTAEWLRREMPKWTEHGDDYKYGEFNPSMWLVTYKNGDPVGSIISAYVSERTVKRYQVNGPWLPFGFIWFIGVIPKYRRRGYGTIMLRKAIALLADKGAKGVGLSVDSANIPAVRLYEKVGFKVTRLEDMLRFEQLK